MNIVHFTKLKLEGVSIEKTATGFTLTGLDADAQDVLQRFLNRPATITIEPDDTAIETDVTPKPN